MTWYHECLVAGPCLSCYFRCSIFLLVWPLSLQCTDWITIEVQLFIWLQISFNLHDCINFNLFVFFPFHKDLVSLSRTILILFLPFFFCCFHYAAWTNSKWEFTTGVWSKYLPQCVSDFLHVLSPLCYLLFFLVCIMGTYVFLQLSCLSVSDLSLTIKFSCLQSFNFLS